MKMKIYIKISVLNINAEGGKSMCRLLNYICNAYFWKMTQMKKYINHIKLISKENSQEEWDNLGDPIQKFDIQYIINILK